MANPLLKLLPQKKKRRYRLSPAGKIKLRQAIQETKPWLKTKGPTTPFGQFTAARNRFTHGLYTESDPDQSRSYQSFARNLRRKLNQT